MFCFVLPERLELSRLTTLDPKSSAATNYAKGAIKYTVCTVKLSFHYLYRSVSFSSFLASVQSSFRSSVFEPSAGFEPACPCGS